MATGLKGSEAVAAFRKDTDGQVVLVLQGGGALDAGLVQRLIDADLISAQGAAALQDQGYLAIRPLAEFIDRVLDGSLCHVRSPHFLNVVWRVLRVGGRGPRPDRLEVNGRSNRHRRAMLRR